MKTIIIAKCVVVGPDDKVLMIRRAATDKRRPLQWDIPGGFVEPHEQFTSAVKREMIEEAGIKTEELLLVWVKNEVNEYGSCIWLFFLTHSTSNSVTLSREHDRQKWMSLEEAIDTSEYPLHKELFKHLYVNDLLHSVQADKQAP